MTPNVVAASVLAVLVGALPPGLFRRDPTSHLQVEPLVITTSMRPKTMLFGEQVTARLDVAYDSDKVRLKGVNARFGTFTVVEESRKKLTIGPDVYLQFRYVLECFTSTCLPPRGGGYAEIPVAKVRYEDTTEGLQENEVEWAPLRIRPRIGIHDFEGRPFSAPLRELPSPSYRFDPGLLAVAAALLALALFTVGAGALAVAFGARARVAAFVARRRSAFSPLHRALDLVRESRDRRERRRALDRLAAELRRRQQADLAVRATGLAWRKVDPSDTMVAPLSEEVERLVDQDGEP